MLNKNDVMPLYMQLQKIIKDDIKNGKYQQGEMIPSETQLCKQYSITRTTVRKAISNLIEEGLLRSEHGKGTFVNLRQVRYNMWNFGGFTDFLKSKNKTPISRILEQEFINLDGKKCYKLVRARGVIEDTEEFLTIDTSYLPIDIFNGIEKHNFEFESLYDVIRKEYGLIPRNVELGVFPIISDNRTEEIFNIDKNTPLLQVRAVVFSDTGLEIEKVNIIYSPIVDFKLLTRMD